MKKLILAVLLNLVATSAFAQSEPFSQFINNLPVATSVGSGDQFYVRQGGISKQVTAPFTLPGMSIIVNPYTPPVTFPGTQPFQIQETVTGTCTAGANNCYYNFINIPSDNAVVGPGNTGSFGTGIGLYENWAFGGAAMTGQRIGATFNVALNATTGNTAGGVSYGALSAVMVGNANDNGTDTSLSNSRGQLEAVNIIGRLAAAATNYRALQGGEVDVAIASGGSAYEKVGWQITQFSFDAVQGATYDVALGITNQSGAIGWKTGILFGGLQGVWPFSSGATAITCDLSCGTLASVLDFSNATISANFLKGPGFSVTGAGTIITSSTTAPSLSGQIGIYGVGASPTFGGTADGAVFLTNGGGLHIQGQGSVDDVVILNKSGAIAMAIPTGTQNVQFTGGIVATAAAPTVAAGQIAYGSTTTAAGTCPTGAVGGQTVVGCIIVNIAGTARNVPFF